jgi:hypothetical protein
MAGLLVSLMFEYILTKTTFARANPSLNVFQSMSSFQPLPLAAIMEQIQIANNRITAFIIPTKPFSNFDTSHTELTPLKKIDWLNSRPSILFCFLTIGEWILSSEHPLFQIKDGIRSCTTKSILNCKAIGIRIFSREHHSTTNTAS